MKLGVLSDTHGLLRPEVLPRLKGVDSILHLGDVGDPAILDTLRDIAPVTAIRGNIDTKGPCARLPETEVLLLEGAYLYLLHNIETLHLDPAAARFAAVLYGHSHKATISRHKGVLYFNPGSCGPRRFNLAVTMGYLHVNRDGTLEPEILKLDTPDLN
ncbi:metallophosphoesterase family protein [Acidobacteria bacterium AB60]|nr:metallophosphoesterase family protein [Acidobacteria bacterium AB60]